MDSQTQLPRIGLFGFIDQAKISNLTVQNPDIEGNYAVGALVGGTSAPGDKRGSSALHGCTVEGGSVSAPTGSVAVGGLIGVVDRKGFLSVESCYNNNTRVSGDYAVGGLVGAGTLYSTINALACNNHGRITRATAVLEASSALSTRCSFQAAATCQPSLAARR